MVEKTKGKILMGNECKINEECGGFLSWKGKRHHLGMGGELDVQKKKERLHNKWFVAQIWAFEKSRTRCNRCVSCYSDQLK